MFIVDFKHFTMSSRIFTHILNFPYSKRKAPIISNMGGSTTVCQTRHLGITQERRLNN